MGKLEKDTESILDRMTGSARPVQVTMFVACPVCLNVSSKKVWAAVGESTRSYTSSRVCVNCR